MEYVVRNRGVILFYLLLIIMTFVVISFNERHLSMQYNDVYLLR